MRNRVGDAQNSPDERAECDFVERLGCQCAVADFARCDGERLRTAYRHQHVGDAVAVGVAGRYAGALGVGTVADECLGDKSLADPGAYVRAAAAELSAPRGTFRKKVRPGVRRSV